MALSFPRGAAARRPAGTPRKRLDKSHYLYIAVIIAVGLGILVGLMFGGEDGFAFTATNESPPQAMASLTCRVSPA